MILIRKFGYHLLVLLTALLLASESVAAAKSLNKEQLLSLFSGNTAVGVHEKKHIKIRDYYGKKGKFISVRSNGDKLRGKWWIGKKYAVICIRYKHKPKKRYCRTIASDGSGGYNKIGSKTGKIYVHYTKVKPGKHTKHFKSQQH